MARRDHIEMSHYAARIFRDDGKLDVAELNALVSMAMRDGIIDNDERRVLRSVLDQLNFDDLTKELIVRIEQLERKFDF